MEVDHCAIHLILHLGSGLLRSVQGCRCNRKRMCCSCSGPSWPSCQCRLLWFHGYDGKSSRTFGCNQLSDSAWQDRRTFRSVEGRSSFMTVEGSDQKANFRAVGLDAWWRSISSKMSCMHFILGRIIRPTGDSSVHLCLCSPTRTRVFGPFKVYSPQREWVSSSIWEYVNTAASRSAYCISQKNLETSY